MIKINLLPAKVSKKKETAKQQVSIYTLSIVLSLLLCGAIYFQTYMKIVMTEDEITLAEERQAALKKTIGEIDQIKKLEAEVKKKLDVLVQLRKGKTGPVRRFVTLSELTPEQLWLTKYQESGSKVSISGSALTEDLIARFMERLEASVDFQGVTLIQSQQAIEKNLKYKKFDLSCELEVGK